MRIGVLHPGEMGVSVAQALLDAGHEPVWVTEGRSAATAERAAKFAGYASLTELVQGGRQLASTAQTINKDTDGVDAIISVCPPHAALAQAQAVTALGFDGLYLDANAIAPDTARQVAQCVGEGYVDGGIIGPPAVKAGSTRLYVSGRHAQKVTDWFAGSVLDCVVLSEDAVAASALKMAYAAYTKGSSALLLAVNALAEQAGVRSALVDEWKISQPDLARRSEQTARGTSRKAWRFVGEMREIAKTFEQAGLPGEFHEGAALLYEKMADLKGLPPSELAVVLNHILRS